MKNIKLQAGESVKLNALESCRCSMHVKRRTLMDVLVHWKEEPCRNQTWHKKGYSSLRACKISFTYSNKVRTTTWHSSVSPMRATIFACFVHCSILSAWHTVGVQEMFVEWINDFAEWIKAWDGVEGWTRWCLNSLPDLKFYESLNFIWDLDTNIRCAVSN